MCFLWWVAAPPLTQVPWFWLEGHRVALAGRTEESEGRGVRTQRSGDPSLPGLTAPLTPEKSEVVVPPRSHSMCFLRLSLQDSAGRQVFVPRQPLASGP